MKSESFNRAKKSYEKGDYAEALKAYYVCLKEDSATFEQGDLGLVYHMLGNCLVKLKRFPDAVDIYERALRDDAYERKAAVHANLGIALIGCERYEDAITSFSIVTADPTYPTPYRAYSGLGNANMKLGRYVDAGRAYRKAAVDENNPHRAKALVNLGECFTMLGRPEDALTTLNTAMDFAVKPAEISSVYEQQGRAYFAMDRFEDAIAAFESALTGNFQLSDDAQADYESAKAALNQSPEEDMYAGLSDDQPYGDEYAYDQAAAMGMAAAGMAAAYDGYDEGYDSQAQGYYDEYGNFVEYAPEDGDGWSEGVDDQGAFFAPNDGNFDQEGGKKGKKNKEGGKKHVGLKILLVVIILLIIALGAGFYAYWIGYGIPTQEQTITGLFEAHANGDDVTEYWVNADEQSIEQSMSGVAKTTDISIDAVERSTVKSSAVVTATLPEGGTVRYEITMSRGGGIFGIDSLAIGWKVSDIDFAFASNQNGSTSTGAIGSVGSSSSSSSTSTDTDTSSDDSTEEAAA